MTDDPAGELLIDAVMRGAPLDDARYWARHRALYRDTELTPLERAHLSLTRDTRRTAAPAP